MKFCIVVCVLLVVAYHETSAYKSVAAVDESCAYEDVEEYLGQCVEIHCKKMDDGKVKRFVFRCPPSSCKDTQPISITKENLAKPYPHCCPSMECA